MTLYVPVLSWCFELRKVLNPVMLTPQRPAGIMNYGDDGRHGDYVQQNIAAALATRFSHVGEDTAGQDTAGQDPVCSVRTRRTQSIFKTWKLKERLQTLRWEISDCLTGARVSKLSRCENVGPRDSQSVKSRSPTEPLTPERIVCAEHGGRSSHSLSFTGVSAPSRTRRPSFMQSELFQPPSSLLTFTEDRQEDEFRVFGPPAAFLRRCAVVVPADSEQQLGHKQQPYSRPTVPGCFSSDGKPQAFQHPVRLYWPKSKSFDYLYSDGEALLRNFPVQATISFYEESDSEDENEEDWEDEDEDEDEECLKPQSHFTSYN
ncbi:Protein ripply1 [Nibea albiflora]|uniref:Protein ripply1 n=1 Tax=Nibea albiflora TaxID=240163 RepID=A0ACB7F2E7_NIBAL|nr:Protein ripply1 [Nibea albiflora]